MRRTAIAFMLACAAPCGAANAGGFEPTTFAIGHGRIWRMHPAVIVNIAVSVPEVIVTPSRRSLTPRGSRRAGPRILRMGEMAEPRCGDGRQADVVLVRGARISPVCFGD